MKKVILVLTLSLAATCYAQHGHWEHRNGSWGWVSPAIVGGVIGYELARPPVVYAGQPVVVQQPVIVEQPTVMQPQQQQCSPWTQVQNPDGSITSTRTCR